MKELRKKNVFAIILITLLCLIVLSAGIFLIYYDKQVSLVWEEAGEQFALWGRPSYAVFCYEHALERDSTNRNAYRYIAEYYLDKNDYSQAERILNRAILNIPEHSEYYVLLCNAYLAQDKLLDAVALLDDITNERAKAEIDAMRPAQPIASSESGTYSEHINVTVTAEGSLVCSSMGGDFPSLNSKSELATYKPPVGTTVILAVSIGEDGLVSRLSRFEFLLEGVNEIAHFQERTIESLVRAQLGYGSEEVITTSDLLNISSLSLVDEKGAPVGEFESLEDLCMLPKLRILNVCGVTGVRWDFLSSLKSLSELSASGCALTTEDISNLSGLNRLVTLDLSDNQISGLDALSGCSELRNLNLSGNSIENIEPLSELTGLMTLDISANVITSIDALSQMKKLNTIDCSYLLVSDISALEGNSSLVNLTFDYCNVEDISPLAGCVNLKFLSCQSNHILTVDALAGCTKLNTLLIARNRVSDIAPFTKLAALKYLDLTSNSIGALPPDLSGMSSLSTLLLANNGISDLAPAGSLAALEMLNIEYNKVSTLEPLTQCGKLKTVNAFGNSDNLYIAGLEDNGVIVYR